MTPLPLTAFAALARQLASLLFDRGAHAKARPAKYPIRERRQKLKIDAAIIRDLRSNCGGRGIGVGYVMRIIRGESAALPPGGLGNCCDIILICSISVAESADLTATVVAKAMGVPSRCKSLEIHVWGQIKTLDGPDLLGWSRAGTCG
ncbi:hypothetical protein B0H19DRAFT_1076073 [Mycena capillaripes]|nr:hypothetical protein B0H19DRAFT_1076073 [Mycena capillaripes]